MPSRLSLHAGRTVMVVDDNAANVALVTALLARHGLTRVPAVMDPRTVATELADKRPDLIVLDLHMPHVDGFGVLDEIHTYAAGRYLPVLIMTADTTHDARNRALECGAHDFLVKPIDADEAVLRIANLLQTADLYDQARDTPPAELSATEFAAVTQRVQRAIAGETLTSVYQPVIEMATGAVAGREALTRFAEPGFGGPDAWFADAARVGLGAELEVVALQRALSSVRMDDAAFVALNLSPTALPLAIPHLLDWSCVDRVVIELTEHETVEDYGALRRSFAPLREHGVRLAADDLGSGTASLRHLIRLEPDIIKLDISLVAGLHRNAEQSALVRALVGFADEVGSRLIAEGVEEPEELDALMSMGVHMAQGYLLGRPEPAGAQS